MHITWNASPEIVAIGPLVLRWYGVLFATGFLIAANVTGKIFARVGQSLESLDILVGYMIAGTIIGARLGHTLIYEPEIFLADPIRILKIWEGGLASHGGALGAMLAAFLWNRKYRKASYLSLLDLLTVPTAIVTTMIRLGNFFNSEILGRPTDFPFAIIFQRVDAQPRHPAMLYEAMAYLFNFFLLRWMFDKREANRRPGLMFGTFLMVLFGARFAIEFLKELQVAKEAAFPLDFGQLLSIPFLILGLILIVRAQKGPLMEAPTPLPEESATNEKSKKKKKR